MIWKTQIMCVTRNSIMARIVIAMDHASGSEDWLRNRPRRHSLSCHSPQSKSGLSQTAFQNSLNWSTAPKRHQRQSQHYLTRQWCTSNIRARHTCVVCPPHRILHLRDLFEIYCFAVESVGEMAFTRVTMAPRMTH